MGEDDAVTRTDATRSALCLPDLWAEDTFPISAGTFSVHTVRRRRKGPLTREEETVASSEGSSDGL